VGSLRQRERGRERRARAEDGGKLGRAWPTRGEGRREAGSGNGPLGKKKAGLRGKRERGRAAEKRRGKATQFRKERERLGLLGWLLLFLPFLFLFPDFPNLTQFNLNPNEI
jgi:hypothetical protein